MSLANIVRGSAEERLNVAANTRTRPAGQLIEYKPRDKVDFYRGPPHKDLTGWRGPAEVVSMDRADEGVIEVRWQGRVLPCRFPDVRRSILWLVFIGAIGRGEQRQYLEVVHALEQMRELNSSFRLRDGR